MSRSGLIALIVIAVLTVAGGVYWYLEFVPLSSLGAKKGGEEIQEPVVAAAAAVAPVVPMAREEIIAEPPMSSEIEAEEGAQIAEEEDAAPGEPAPDEIVASEVEVTIIPFPELEHLFGSDLFALAEPFPIDLSVFGPEEHPQPEREIESIAVIAEEPAVDADEPLLAQPVVEQPVAAAADAPPSPAAIPTARVESEPVSTNWLVGAKISIVHRDLATFGPAGLGFEVDFMRRHNDLFSWGGTAVVAKDADWRVDLLFNARWTPRANEKLSFPLTLSLGPSLLFSPTTSFAVAARAQAGISYALTERLSLFYEAGIGARYGVGSGFSASLEPIKIGFSYSF